MISPTIFVQKLAISKVDHFCIDIIFGEFIEMRESCSSHTVGTVYCPGDLVLPAEVVC